MMAAHRVTSFMFCAAVVGLPATSALAQSSPCRVVASMACQTAQWEAANAAFDADRALTLPPRRAGQLLVDFLKRPDMALPANDLRRAQALQLLANVRLGLQDSKGSIEAGRQALAIWQRRANIAEIDDRRFTTINLANALVQDKEFDEAEALALKFLTELGPVSEPTKLFRLAGLGVLANALDGRKGPVEERLRRHSEIVALIRGQSVQPDEIGSHRLALAAALGNLANAQTDAATTEPAAASLAEVQMLLTSVGLLDSDRDLVVLRMRYLPLLATLGERCELENVALAVLPYAEPFGQRVLSQILIQQGENYRNYGTTSRAVPLWSRATALELAMACPAETTRRAGPGPSSGPSPSPGPACTGSPLLIDHLRSVGMALRYERQGRASAGYRSLYQAGDFLRTRTLSGFVLNRDSAKTYGANRDIFADQVTAAWAINDPAAAPKPVEVTWNCAPR